MNPFDEENFSGWGMPPMPSKEDIYPTQYNPPSRTEQINTLLDEWIKQKEALKVCKKGKGGAKLLSAIKEIILNIEDQLINLK